MEQGSYWEADIPSVRQEITTFYATRMNLTMFTTACHSLCPVLSQLDPTHIFTPYSSVIHFKNIVSPSMSESHKWPFPFRFTGPFCMHFSYLSCVLHSPPISYWFGNPGDIFLWSSLLCSFLQHPVTSCFLRPSILIALFSNTLSPRSFRTMRDQFHSHLKQQVKL
jgi:hypothetical protein